MEGNSGGAILYASPVRMGSLSVQVPSSARRGADLVIEFVLGGVGGAQLPGIVPVRWSLSDPDGRLVLYERVGGLERGRAQVSVPLPVNGPVGQYLLQAREIATGQALRRDIVVC